MYRAVPSGRTRSERSVVWVENKVNFDKPLNIMVAAITMIIAIGQFAFTVGGISFNGIAIGTVSASVAALSVDSVIVEGNLVDDCRNGYIEVERSNDVRVSANLCYGPITTTQPPRRRCVKYSTEGRYARGSIVDISKNSKLKIT